MRAVKFAGDINQTIPIAGSFAGPNDAMSSMDVAVDVVGI